MFPYSIKRNIVGVFSVLLFLTCYHLQAQTFEVSGTIKDAQNMESLIGVSVLYAENKGVASDLDGNFKIQLNAGKHKLTFSYVGYETQQMEINVNANMVLNVKLASKTVLKEIEIVADVARNRETPVAFSTIPIKQLQQELGTRDLPMVLNSTPGVYATESGGGSGDARINVRGFDQRNVAVMIDGIPFNDMENGAVYWSNWEGLGDVTGSMQVQRGLGASKLALPSVGGTLNILTKGIDQKAEGVIKQEIGNNNSLRTSVSYNSGVMKNGLGITTAFSKRTGDGWVDQTWIKSYSYFFKIQKRVGEKHLISASINGATQKHAQRYSQYSMAVYDIGYGLEHGMSQGFTDTLSMLDKSLNKGLRYNRQWGTYIDKDGKEVIVNERVNFYSKPVISISDFYNINSNLTLSTVAYLSKGTGGGTTMQNLPANPDSTTGQYNYQNSYNTNTLTGNASTFSRTSYNDHFWYGLLSSINYKITKNLNYQLGADLRSYRGTHYQTAYDLIGGTYLNDISNNNQPQGINDQEFQIKKQGDKIGYYYDGIVKWGGAFTQLEYKTDKFSAFVNVTGSVSNYQRKDYFAKKDLVLSDTTYKTALGYADTIVHNGVAYNYLSPEAQTASTESKNFLGYTFKSGGNYNINENHNVFINAGYLKLAPKFVHVFDRNNRLFGDIDYQYVKAIEGGYGYRTSGLSVNVNAYYTVWKNRPPDFTPSKLVDDPILGETVLYYNINGLDALHKGIEIDAAYKLNKVWSFNGLISIGDWRYTSKREYYIIDANGNPAIDPYSGKPYGIQTFSAVGVHVGNAAQIQYSGTVNFEPIKSLYIKARYTYFDKNYASFDPTSLKDENADRESWKIPAYGTLDAFSGYSFKIYKSYKLSLGVNVINVLNTKYISDAQNNGLSNRALFGGKTIGNRFNAESAGVFFGQGRRFNISAKFIF
ncbi:MAG: TonB-dependent receptor [Bacteroidia bacterium]|nr:TonB-dependent receptor [Bacteroidia bacterium]MCZ2247395.1 TonB-dependent receptor [Bacteroidia bacterium]